MNSLSKIFKSSRVILDEKAFVLKNRTDHPVKVDEPLAAKEGVSPSSSDAIISDAYDQAKGIMEQAKQEGYKEGYEQGLQRSREEGNEIIRQAEAIKNAWINERAEIFQSVEKETIELVLEVVEKILNHHVETDVTLVESLIKMGLQRVTRTEQLSIRVSTDDYNQAIAVKPIILAMSDKIEEIEIKRDVTLPNGSCIIDADSGSVDSGVWTQFEEVSKLFEDMLKGE
jgi:flagellar assembly protein FliH